MFSTVLARYNKNKKEKNLFDSKIHAQTFFIAVSDTTLKSFPENALSDVSGSVFLYQKMNCMLGGICGRCIKPDGTYACINNIAVK